MSIKSLTLTDWKETAQFYKYRNNEWTNRSTSLNQIQNDILKTPFYLEINTEWSNIIRDHHMQQQINT